MQQLANINEAWARKYPEQVVLVITGDLSEKVNIMAVGWVAIVSDEPPMYMLGIDDNAYTLELIRKNREFVIAFPSSNMAQATLYCGTVHGHNVNKAAESKLKFTPAGKTAVPLLEDAVANLECKLVTEYRPGNCPLVIGEVVAAHVNTDPEVKRLINAGAGYDLK